jgi:cell division protein FtsI/penicillin-binding protein 2
MLTSPRRNRRTDAHILNIPGKANRVLNLIMIALLLITIRLWHLSVVQYQERVEQARRPLARVVVEPAKRATIRDRYNIPLAINKIRYQAAILYSQLSEIPSVAWEYDGDHRRVKRFKRREYITALSQLLGKELAIDPDRIEDLIHSKASFYHQIPFIVKEDLSESEYYRLKMLEKDWQGIQVVRVPRRDYPQGSIGADIIGYMGAINKSEYDAIILEIKTLERYLKEEETGDELEIPYGLTSAAEARNRLRELQEKAYTINDYVGKTGIEGVFEEELRGYHGKKSFYTDAKGNYLRELPGTREPLSGHRLLLTISSELQEYAEQLLVQNERIREPRVSREYGRSGPLAKQPWIKGGAIVAMDPNNGEVIALASHPRFDPNDFILSGNPSLNKKKKANIQRWFETDLYLADLWDQRRPLVREIFTNHFYEEERWISWNNYLDFILPNDSPVLAAFDKILTVQDALSLEREMEGLRQLLGEKSSFLILNRLYQGDPFHQPHRQKMTVAQRVNLEEGFRTHSKQISEIKKRLERFWGEVPQNYDKVMIVDLSRLVVTPERFSDLLLAKVGSQRLSSYRDASSAFLTLAELLRSKAKVLFHQIEFIPWRKANEKEFLKERRKEEKLAKKYPKPYLDYLDAKENELFDQFWKDQRWELIAAFINESAMPSPYLEAFEKEREQILSETELPHKNFELLHATLKELTAEETIAYLQSFRSFNELDQPLLGKYRHLRNNKGVQLEKHLAAAFYPVYGFGYGRSQAYRQSAIQGSIFKLVTAYEALKQLYEKRADRGESLASLNPFEMIDDAHKKGDNWYVGYQMNGAAIPQLYKGGRIPRTRVANIGRVDLLKALEVSSNPYFSLLAGDILESPEDLSAAAREFSFGKRTGIDLPAELPGKVPDDLESNRTGLYSMAIGQHTLVVTPLQTAVMLSALANGGKIYKPKIVSLTAGRERKSDQQAIVHKSSFSYQDSLALVGIDFPLFTAADQREQQQLVKRVSTEVLRELFMPEQVRHILLIGMERVVQRTQQEGLSGLNKIYQRYPEAMRAYLDLKEDILGKTSTSEAIENLNLDLQGSMICTHVWFGGIGFNKKGNNGYQYVYTDQFGKPELVVVVYLKYGGFGKEAAPLGSLILKKWREIKLREQAPTR